MHFDRLDESYTMVKSNLNFDKVTLTGQTSFGHQQKVCKCGPWTILLVLGLPILLGLT